MRPDGNFFAETFDDVFRGLAAFARRMAEASGTDAVLNVEDEIVARPWRNTHGDSVQLDVFIALRNFRVAVGFIRVLVQIFVGRKIWDR